MMRLKICGSKKNQDSAVEAEPVLIPIHDVPLPHFSVVVQKMLSSQAIFPHWLWVKTVQESASFYLNIYPTGLKDSSIYQRIGRAVYSRYPSIGAPGRKPWSKFIKSLSQKIRHLRHQRLRVMSQLDAMGADREGEASLHTDQDDIYFVTSSPSS